MGPVETDVTARLAAIARHDPRISAFIRIDGDSALAAAREADARRAEGRALGPLDGVAVGVKDNLAVGGAPWTAGIAGRRFLGAAMDAGVVARLRAAGAVLVGGLNLDEGALGATCDNAAYGRCINPLADGFTPGGSSGGSGAAVAAGFVAAALGTDTMGSARIPAAYCGLSAIKPTTGLIGRSGLAFLSPTLDTIGVLAPRVADLWRFVETLAGVDPGDPDSRPAPPGWTQEPTGDGLAGRRLGVPRQLADVDCEPPVRAGFARALAAARDAGATIVDADLAGWEPGPARRAGLLLVEAEGAAVLDELIDVDGALSESLRAMLRYGRAASSAKIVAALARIRAAAAACARGLGEADALILPTAPQRAFPHGASVPANQADLTALANFAGAPAVALPVPLPGEMLPASVQLVGPSWSEVRLLTAAQALQRSLDAPS